MQLRDYQQACINNIVEDFTKHNSIMVVLATGAGKTVIFSKVIDHYSGEGKALVLAHRSELLDQAKDKINKIAPNLSVGIEQAENTVSDRHDVVVASVQTLGRAGSKRIEKFNPMDFSLIVVDETHHVIAGGYQNIIDYFKAGNPNIKILGVTATPDRADKKDLMTIFEKISFEYGIMRAIYDGYLVDMKCYTVRTGTDISNVSIRMGDYAQNELSDAINTPERNAQIVKSYGELSMGQAVAFCIDIAHCTALRDMFLQHGVPCEMIIGDTEKENRDQIYENFRNGTTKVLVNVMVCTEGRDEPVVDTILMARPTKSRSLYQQIIGRGLRLMEGKTACKIVDFTDNTKKLSISIANMLGLENATIDGKGKSFKKMKEDLDELSKVMPMIEGNIDLDNVKLLIQEYDIMKWATIDQDIMGMSYNTWTKIANGYELGLSKDEFGKYETLQVIESLIGWELYYINGYEREKVGDEKTIEEIIKAGDEYLQEYKSDKSYLVDNRASRRKAPASDGQLGLIRRLGYKIPSTGMNKGQASNIISNLLKK